MNRTTIIKIMPKTGKLCKVAGIYQCKTHPDHQITVDKGEVFPCCVAPGPAKVHDAEWMIVVKTYL